jgi:hypothetical protein
LVGRHPAGVALHNYDCLIGQLAPSAWHKIDVPL